MRKVLAIAPYSYLPYFSGGQKYNAQFFDAISKHVDLTVITVAENDFSLAKDYTAIGMMKKKFTRYIDLSLVGKLTRLIKQEKYDTLICIHPYLSWLLYRLRKRTGIRIIILTHNLEFIRFRSTGRWWWPILKWYEKRCLQKADLVFFVSPEERDFAIQQWKLASAKCIDLPFGIEISGYPTDKKTCRDWLVQRYQLNPAERILVFAGLLSYQPNWEAVQYIVEKINPLLLAKQGFQYKIIICGKGLPADMNELRDYADKNIIFAGFAEDITVYYKGADIMLNPVQSGAGIKTKMVEAIAYGTTVVSTKTGSLGIHREVCGEKLFVVKDNDWTAFADHLATVDYTPITPEVYYQQYYWPNISKKIVAL